MRKVTLLCGLLLALCASAAFAGGTNIQSTSDSFHFAYRQVTGDFDIKAQITSMTGTTGSPKAGLMARTSLAANSANVYAHIASNGYRISRRASTGPSR